MPRNPVEDWLQTLAAGLIAATLPLVAGWTVRLFGPELLRAFPAGRSTEQSEAVANVIAPVVVLVCGPIVVFLFARWAARLTRGSPMLRATIVGLTPAVLSAWLIAQRDASAVLTGSAPVKLWALVAWALLNLAAGMLAGVLKR